MGDMFGISAGVSGLLGGLTGAAGAYYGNNMASSAAGEAQNWQQYMSATQYQRAVKDLKRAGLNPMLAYMQGGSSAGSAPHQQVYAPDLSGFGDVGKMVSSGLAAKTARDNIKIVEADRRAAQANAKRADYEANAAQYSEVQALQNILSTVQERDRVNADTERLRALRQNVDADTSWIAAKDWSTRAAIPYSPEQMRATKEMRELLEKPGQAIREVGKSVGSFLSSGRQIRDTLGAHERRTD